MPSFNTSPIHTVPTIDQVIEAAISGGDRSEVQSVYQSILDSKAAEFDTYAGLDRPQFEFTEDPNIGTAAFVVYPDGSHKVMLNLNFFIKKKLNANQIEWVMYHELTHFMDYANNPELYMEQFQKAKELATKMTKYICEEVLTSGEATDSQRGEMEKSLTSIYSSGYYNVVNDIYVNHNVETLPKYSRDKTKYPASRYHDIVNLYKYKLIQSQDMSSRYQANSRDTPYKIGESNPEFYQYLFFLLRGENVPEGMRVTEGTQEALARDYNLEYKKYDVTRGTTVTATLQMNTQEVIYTFLNPNRDDRLVHDKKGNTTLDKDTSLVYRSEYVDATLLPTFTELMRNDIHMWCAYYRSTIASKDEQSPLEHIAQNLIDWLGRVDDNIKASSPDIVPEEMIKSYADWKKGRVKPTQTPIPNPSHQGSGTTTNAGRPPMTPEEIKALRDAAEAKARADKEAREQTERQSTEEKQRVARERAVADFAKAKKIKEETAKRVAAAWHDVAPYIGALDDVWRRIMSKYGNENRSVLTGRHSNGAEVDVNAVINQLPDLLGGRPDLFRPFARMRSVESPSERPERIKVRLLIDQSSSMQGLEGAKSSKNKMIDRLLTMMYMSQDNFNMRLANNKAHTGSPMHMDTQTIVYGGIDQAKVCEGLDFLYTRTGIDGANNDIRSGVKGEQNYKALESVGIDMGSTYDDQALDIVLKSIGNKEKQKIKDGKVLDIVILITDGGSSDWVKSKERVDALLIDGVTVFAFQIGKVSLKELEIFNKVWNQNTDNKIRGVSMGSDFTKLPAVLAQMLIDMLGDIEI